MEKQFRGVHEFKVRSDCYTAEFVGEHPESIRKDMQTLKETFSQQLDKYDH